MIEKARKIETEIRNESVVLSYEAQMSHAAKSHTIPN